MMKGIYILVIALFISTGAFGQSIQISERSVSLEQGRQNGYVVELNTNDLNMVESEWKSFMKKYEAKPEGKLKKEMFSDNAEIKKMSANFVDVYAKGEASGDKIFLSCCFDLGGAFVSSSTQPEANKVAIELLTAFALQVNIRSTETRLKEEEKVLKSLEKDLDNLEKDKEKYERDIEDAEKLIEQRKKDIEENRTNQAEKNEEIKTQTEVIKGTEKQLKGFKK